MSLISLSFINFDKLLSLNNVICDEYKLFSLRIYSIADVEVKTQYFTHSQSSLSLHNTFVLKTPQNVLFQVCSRNNLKI